MRHARANAKYPTPRDPKSKFLTEKMSYHRLNGLLSPPYFQMSQAAGYYRVLPPRRFVLSFVLQYEIEMLSMIAHWVLHSLQTSKRTPSSSPAYPVRRSGPHPRTLPRQSEGAFRIFVRSKLIEATEVIELSRDSGGQYCHA